MRTLSQRETLDVIERFYQECLSFWKSENEAIKSVRGLTTNPYSVDGELLHQHTLQNWLNEHQ